MLPPFLYLCPRERGRWRAYSFSLSLFRSYDLTTINLIIVFLTVSFASIVFADIACVRIVTHFHWQMQIRAQKCVKVLEPTKTHLEYGNNRAKIAAFLFCAPPSIAVRPNDRIVSSETLTISTPVQSCRFRINVPIIYRALIPQFYLCMLCVCSLGLSKSVLCAPFSFVCIAGRTNGQKKQQRRKRF